jgi:hypothetical protein
LLQDKRRGPSLLACGDVGQDEILRAVVNRAIQAAGLDKRVTNPLQVVNLPHAGAELPQLCLHFLQPIRTFQHVARAAAVGRADDAVALHHVENARGAAIA